jgi:aryl sulfotransferase
VSDLIDYSSADDDNRRWNDFPFRAGDIVISTRSKHGTTWMQWICALLVHRRPEIPAPLAELSPWLDQLVEPLDVVVARLDAQTHRRIIKTHTPLDGIPMHPGVTFVVVGRDPLDAAVSLYHQGANLDRARIAELSGVAQPPTTDRPPLADWLRAWIEFDAAPRDALESPRGVLHHITDAWKRQNAHDVVLVHYDDLVRDLAATMATVAQRLAIEIDDTEVTNLAASATFESMRRVTDLLVPDRLGVLRDREAFFRRGSSGAASEVLDRSEIDRFWTLAASYAPPEVCAWLCRSRPAHVSA